MSASLESAQNRRCLSKSDYTRQVVIGRMKSVSSKVAMLKVPRSDLARFQEDSSSDNVTHTRRQERFIISDSESHDEVTAGNELFRELRGIEQIERPDNLEGDENSDEEQAQINRQLQAELNTYLEETVEDQDAGHYLRKKRLQSAQRSTRLASVESQINSMAGSSYSNTGDSEHDEEQEHSKTKEARLDEWETLTQTERQQGATQASQGQADIYSV
ncbi:hypothetical protein LTR64_001509 [Lithohypha guttulata]|uniref:uncharacterized protein n=1 Tax=Lithohypha guttulata TaxID=1690604 RepID=UPI002DE18638|nr:hypothetical protein LTR51_003703 [Lithohypha guttulata]